MVGLSISQPIMISIKMFLHMHTHTHTKWPSVCPMV